MLFSSIIFWTASLVPDFAAADDSTDQSYWALAVTYFLWRATAARLCRRQAGNVASKRHNLRNGEHLPNRVRALLRQGRHRPVAPICCKPWRYGRSHALGSLSVQVRQKTQKILNFASCCTFMISEMILANQINRTRSEGERPTSSLASWLSSSRCLLCLSMITSHS